MSTIIPNSLKDAPALIEKIFPVQKLSIESYKEQMPSTSKTLTALGSFWKGRKPLVLSKACILGCLLPVTNNLKRDLEIFEKLMAMDKESLVVRLGRIKPEIIIENVALSNIYDYFVVEPNDILPMNSPINLEDYRLDNGKLPTIQWNDYIEENEKRHIESLAIPQKSYRELIYDSDRAETCLDVHDHIWEEVNEHLGTKAASFPELIHQLGIMRYGHRPKIADTFSGSGQIPFEAARLGCDVYASDLNPISCMLTWGAANIVGGTPDRRENIDTYQRDFLNKIRKEIETLGVETDGNGWRGKVYLYCVEVICPQSGWKVPLLPTLVISKGYKVVAKLVPDIKNKRYDINICSGVTDDEMKNAEKGTVRCDGRGQDSYLFHTLNGKDYKTKIPTLRGDYTNDKGFSENKLRLWGKTDFKPQEGDIFQERLYAIQWMRPKKNRKGYDYEFRTVTEEDLRREAVIEEYLNKNFERFQENGWIPDMRIEIGYNTKQPIWERGWSFWHQLFNPRQLLLASLVNSFNEIPAKIALSQFLQYNSRLSRWNPSGGGGGCVINVFDNQALNTLFNYAARGLEYSISQLNPTYKNFPLPTESTFLIENHAAAELSVSNDIYITDPPYGDAVKYEEILEFFIAWLRKNPPEEFSTWVWDSRRYLAIKGEDEDFRRGMVAAYKKMAENMPDNGLQIIMFTHQSGSIWADMANIVWASGLQVTATWYVVTETDSPLREGSYIKGTIILVLRKRLGSLRTSRDDLAWDIQEEVEEQVDLLVGLTQEVKDLYRNENLFEDADLQMAGYAAALRVLTRYSVIDGKDMSSEAIRPRVKGQKTFVDELIEFAVGVANQSLVPQGISKSTWDKLIPAERFYLKLIDLEAKGLKTLDNYQNFAKAFKVKDFKSLMGAERANSARLKTATEFGKSEMSGDSEFAGTLVRCTLYALMELIKNTDGEDVLKHLSHNVPNYYDQAQRFMIVEISDYLDHKLNLMRPEEASAARVLRELVKNHRM